jgi:hypothetical protein
MTDETNYPPKSKVELPKKAKKKRKDWGRPKEKSDEDPPRTSSR